ncbi:MAG TPA: trypsin-like peptidase domain-containing protein [Allosphingosinicella sp.]
MERTSSPVPTEPQRRGGAGRALVAFLALLLAAFGGAAAYSWLLRGTAAEPEARIAGPTPVDAVPLSRLTLAPLVDRVSPGVVNIAVLQSSPLDQNPLLRDPYYRYFMGVPDEALEPRVSAGSGFVVDAARGLVVTNNHVIHNASAIQVTLGDRRLPARLVGTDPDIDIALLQIPPGGLKQLALGDSDKLKVGDYVVAIGNPFEIGQTVTAGIVSALGHRGDGGAGTSYVQTDAPINPGNSGGPLIGMRGEVIGINTAIVGPGEGNVGIGLAVPSNVARRVIERLARSDPRLR